MNCVTGTKPATAEVEAMANFGSSLHALTAKIDKDPDERQFCLHAGGGGRGGALDETECSSWFLALVDNPTGRVGGE